MSVTGLVGRVRRSLDSKLPIAVHWPAWARAHPLTLKLRLVLVTAAAVVATARRGSSTI